MKCQNPECNKKARKKYCSDYCKYRADYLVEKKKYNQFVNNEWRKNNPEKNRERCNRWRAKHPKSYKAQQRRYYLSTIKPLFEINKQIKKLSKNNVNINIKNIKVVVKNGRKQ